MSKAYVFKALQSDCEAARPPTLPGQGAATRYQLGNIYSLASR